MHPLPGLTFLAHASTFGLTFLSPCTNFRITHHQLMQLVPVNLPLPEVCDTAPKADRQLSVLCRYTERKRTVMLSHQRPVRVVGLHCQARFDPPPPPRQCSLYGLSHQLDSGGGSSHSCPPLDFLKRLQSDHTCHPPHRFNELGTNNDKWNGRPWLECVDGRHPPSKFPVCVLPWTSCREGR